MGGILTVHGWALYTIECESSGWCKLHAGCETVCVKEEIFGAIRSSISLSCDAL